MSKDELTKTWTLGPITGKAAFMISGGTTFSEELVVFILLTRSESSIKETCWKLQNKNGLAGKFKDRSESCEVKDKRMSLTLSTKNVKKLSQSPADSSLEYWEIRLITEFIVENKILGLWQCAEIRSEKYFDLADLAAH